MFLALGGIDLNGKEGISEIEPNNQRTGIPGAHCIRFGSPAGAMANCSPVRVSNQVHTSVVFVGSSAITKFPLTKKAVKQERCYLKATLVSGTHTLLNFFRRFGICFSTLKKRQNKNHIHV